MSNKKFCVYLTVYYGNKLPPFYIGWSSRPDKVLAQEYHGSISSKEYKEIYKQELEENPHLFKSFVLSYQNTKKEATEKEEYFHRKFDVIKNSMYFNMAIGRAKFSRSGPHSEETKVKISKKTTGREAWNKGKPNEKQKTKMLENNPMKDPEVVKKCITTRTKNNKPMWNKGKKLKKHSDTMTKEELSIKYGNFGENNPFYGKDHSPEIKQVISDASKNTVVVRFINGDGTCFRVSLDEYHSRKGIDLETPSQGKIHSNKFKESVSKRTKGTVPVRNKNGDGFRISVEEYNLRKNIDVWHVSKPYNKS